jgi:SAM-dependent methyltransferase
VSEASVARDYDRWLSGPSITGRLYAALAGLPGTILVNTPAFKLHTELQIRPEHRVLDIGCGTGAVLQTLASRVDFETPPIGIDLSRTLLRQGRSTFGGNLSRPELIRASGLSLPFPDEYFDIVTCAHVVKHLDDDGLLEFLREMRRVIKHGGIGLVWEFAPTTSARLNAWNKFVLSPGVSECNFRDYTTLSAYALEAGFEWAGNAHLRPFLYPPIPRISVLVGKAPVGWADHDHSAQSMLAQAASE